MKASRYKKKQEPEKNKFHDNVYFTIGYVWALACSYVDRGEDIRHIAIPEVVKDYKDALNTVETADVQRISGS